MLDLSLYDIWTWWIHAPLSTSIPAAVGIVVAGYLALVLVAIVVSVVIPAVVKRL